MKRCTFNRGFIHGGVHRSGLAHGGEPLAGWEEPISGDCYKVGSRGPCPLGQLVVFERYSGKSFRGECGCSEGYNQNYWPQTDQCYEWYSQVTHLNIFTLKEIKKDRNIFLKKCNFS